MTYAALLVLDYSLISWHERSLIALLMGERSLISLRSQGHGRLDFSAVFRLLQRRT